jgi:MFS family permease
MKNLTLMTVIAFTLFMSSGVTGPISSLYVESLGASYVTIGLLGTVTSLTTILFSYLWGHASDRLGRRKVFLVSSLGVLAVSYGLIAIVPNYVYLFPLRILSATAQAAYGTASLALMGDLLERHSQGRGRRMGVFRGLCSLGFGLMAFLSGSIAEWGSLRAPFGLAAVLLLITFFLALRVSEPRAIPAERSAEPVTLGRTAAALRAWLASTWQEARIALTQLFRRPWVQMRSVRPEDPESKHLPIAPLLISAFLWSLVVGAVYAVWANYMVDEVGYSQAQMSRLWSLASLSEFPLMILAGWLSDRIGRVPMMSLGFLAWALVFLGYVMVPHMPWLIFVQLTRGFAYSAYTATAMTYAIEVRARSQRGEASGLYSSAGGIGSILGSSMGGGITQLSSFKVMISANALIILAGAVYLATVALRQAVRVRAYPQRGEGLR